MGTEAGNRNIEEIWSGEVEYATRNFTTKGEECEEVRIVDVAKEMGQEEVELRRGVDTTKNTAEGNEKEKVSLPGRNSVAVICKH